MGAMLLFASLISSTAAAERWYNPRSSAGGAQRFAEEIMEHTVAHGAPPHPLHETRGTVRTGQVGAAAFTVGSKPSERFSHFFETSVGSGHMSLTLREDWRNHIRMAARDLGVKHIRGHGLLDDDMSVSFAYGKHAFYNIDSLVDVLSSVGMRPIFELSFMPDWLTNGTDTVSSPLLAHLCSLASAHLCSLSHCSLTCSPLLTQVCHYKGNSDPPKNYTEWGELIGALGQHMVDKYGEQVASEMFFEVWNEPNDNFWCDLSELVYHEQSCTHKLCTSWNFLVYYERQLYGANFWCVQEGGPRGLLGAVHSGCASAEGRQPGSQSGWASNMLRRLLDR